MQLYYCIQKQINDVLMLMTCAAKVQMYMVEQDSDVVEQSRVRLKCSRVR